MRGMGDPLSPLPSRAAELTAAWLSEALGAPVASFVAEDIGTGVGIFGEIVRVRPTYATAARGAPATVIAKFPTQEPANRQVGVALGPYEREVRFYRHVLPRSPLRVPRCYLAAEDRDAGVWVLLLEDLAHLEMGDQLAGLPPARADAVVDALAGLHAAWWDRPELAGFDWLPVVDAPAYCAVVPGIFRTGLPVLRDGWADVVGAEAVALAEAVEPRFEEVMARCGTGPQTVIHTDSRLDNLFFDAVGGVTVIDFQLGLRGRGVSDIAYLVGSSMEPADQAAHWERLLARYHAGLVARGVSGYSLAQCRHDYLEHVLYYLCSPLSLIATFDTGNERGAALTRAFTMRFLAHAVGSGALAVL
jgi:aminoglycoside/choline kinase family phosphotransferase